ncbi:MAG: O-antigen ligase family protein [Xenococcaceae cyanobacterium]
MTVIALNFTSLCSFVREHKTLSRVFLAFYIWIWFSALNSEFLGTAIRYGIKYSTYIIAFASLLVLTYAKRDKTNYDKFVFRLLILIAIGGIVECVFPHLWLLNLIRHPDNYPRISSIVQGPNQFGVLMSVGAIFSIILYKYKKNISKVEFGLIILLFIVLICLSGSLNSWLIFLIGLFLLLFYRIIKARGFMMIIIVWIFCLSFFPVSADKLGLVSRYNNIFPLMHHVVKKGDKTSKPKWTKNNQAIPVIPSKVATSSADRIQLWKAAINETIKRPMTGIGIGVFAEHIGLELLGSSGLLGLHTHNIFLSVMVELGIPGLLIFITLMYGLIKIIKMEKIPVIIPLILVSCAQIVDFFINDYTFTIIGLYFLSSAINSDSELFAKS